MEVDERCQFRRSCRQAPEFRFRYCRLTLVFHQVRKSLMNRRVQFACPHRIFRGLMQPPEMGLAEGTQRSFWRLQIDHVLVFAIHYSDHSMLQGPENAVSFQILAECKSFLFSWIALLQPLCERLASHVLRLGLSRQVEDGRRKRGFVRGDPDALLCPLTRQPDD